jgi:hypothetical protein
MNGPLPPVISFDKSAAGPAGRGVVTGVELLGAAVVVVADPDFPLLPLEQAEANSASVAHATSAPNGTVLWKVGIRSVFRPAAGNCAGT